MADSLAVVGAAARPDAATLWRLYVDEGLAIAVMAKRWGVAAQPVHNWLVAAGVPRRPSPATRRADVRDDEIVRLYSWGHTAAEIADRLGCSASLVYFRLERRGVARRPRVPRRGGRPADAELNHLYWDCGLSLRDLAGRYGVSRRAVHGWLVAAGIERRPPGAVAVVGDGDDPVGLYEGGWSGLCSVSSAVPICRFRASMQSRRRRYGAMDSASGERVAELDTVGWRYRRITHIEPHFRGSASMNSFPEEPPSRQ